VTSSTGIKTWEIPPTVTGSPVNVPVVNVDGGPAVVAGTGTTGNDEDDMAIVDAAISGDVEDKVTAGQGMAGLGQQWSNIKNQIDNKFGDFQPMAQGSLPRATTLACSLDFGRLGSRNISLDLTQSPYTVARDIALVFVTIHAAWFFIQYLKV